MRNHLTLRQVFIILTLSLTAAIVFNALSVSGISWVYHPREVVAGAEIHLYEAWEIYKGKAALFIDARNVSFYNRSHIPGARNIPYNSREVQRLSADLKKNANIVVYCFSSGCHQADILAGQLKKLGFTHVAIFRDGYRAWKKANFPLTATGD